MAIASFRMRGSQCKCVLLLPTHCFGLSNLTNFFQTFGVSDTARRGPTRRRFEIFFQLLEYQNYGKTVRSILGNYSFPMVLVLQQLKKNFKPSACRTPCCGVRHAEDLKKIRQIWKAKTMGREQQYYFPCIELRMRGFQCNSGLFLRPIVLAFQFWRIFFKPSACRTPSDGVQHAEG